MTTLLFWLWMLSTAAAIWFESFTLVLVAMAFQSAAILSAVEWK